MIGVKPPAQQEESDYGWNCRLWGWEMDGPGSIDVSSVESFRWL